MCGIMGFVGQSKYPEKTFRLATALLQETASRGTDATGFYAVNSERFFFEKASLHAHPFIRQSQNWEEACLTSNCLIGHNRMTTHGPHEHNYNNHPHTIADDHFALVHNGIVGSFRSIAHDLGIQLKTECDTEILVRLIELEDNADDGIQTAFQHAGFSGGFACLAIDNRGENPIFYAFKNMAWPIVLIDLRKELGQIFFSSAEYIWRKVLQISKTEKYFRRAEVLSFGPDEILKVDPLTLKCKRSEGRYSRISRYSQFYPEERRFFPYRHKPAISVDAPIETTPGSEINPCASGQNPLGDEGIRNPIDWMGW